MGAADAVPELVRQTVTQRHTQPCIPMLQFIDTPHGLKPDGFSVLRRSQRHASPTALPKPLYVLGGVVVSVQAGSAVRASVPADGQTFLHHSATARTRLAGVGRIDSNH